MRRRNRAPRSGDVLVEPLESFTGPGGTFTIGVARMTSVENAARLETAGRVRVIPSSTREESAPGGRETATP